MLTSLLSIHQCWMLTRWGQWVWRAPDLEYITPLLGTLQWTPVDSLRDLNLSCTLNSTLLPEFFIYISSCGIHSGKRRSTVAQLNKSQALLLHLRLHEKKKNTLNEKNDGLHCPLLSTAQLGNYVPFWKEHSRRWRGWRGSVETQVAIQKRSSDLVTG